MTSANWESREVASFWRYIASSLDRLVGLAADLGEPGMYWQPPAPNANSIAVLVVHTLGNAEENILETLCGQTVGRNRTAEFEIASISVQQLQDQWFSIRLDMETALMQLSASELDREHLHPRRGMLPGRDILIVVARHAAEHLGQAELTRDLWLVQQQ